jgi:hypothetical protein
MSGERKDIVVQLSAVNAATVDREGDALADAEGHVVTASVVRSRSAALSPAPVRAQVDHGVSAASAASMLRKMANLVEAGPGILSAEPGTGTRLRPDGSVETKRITPEQLRDAAKQFDGEIARRLLDVADLIEPDPPFPTR